MLKIALRSAMCTLVAGCASFSTSITPTSEPPQDGLLYYMPQRAFVLTVSIDKDGVPTPSVTVADVEADRSRAFTLAYEQSWVGKNSLNVTTNSVGLLTSAGSTVESGIADLAKSLGRTAGTISALVEGARPATAVPAACTKGQTYSLIYSPGNDPTDPMTLCGLSISVVLDTSRAVSGNTPRLATEQRRQFGVFYRRELPYRVSVSRGSTTLRSFLVFSPNESPIYFYPLTRTLFSNNEMTLTFASPGILTGVQQNAAGELVAAASLPADVLTEYFKAIGGIFSSIGTNRSNETTSINNSVALEVARQKQQACAAVIAANPIAGRTAQDVQTALAAIKAACQ